MPFLNDPNLFPSPEWEEWQKKIALGNVFPQARQPFAPMPGDLPVMGRPGVVPFTQVPEGGARRPIQEEAIRQFVRHLQQQQLMNRMAQENARGALFQQTHLDPYMRGEAVHPAVQADQAYRAAQIAAATGGDPAKIQQMLARGQGGWLQTLMQDIQAGRPMNAEVNPVFAQMAKQLGIQEQQQQQTGLTQRTRPRPQVRGPVRPDFELLRRVMAQPQRRRPARREVPHSAMDYLIGPPTRGLATMPGRLSPQEFMAFLSRQRRGIRQATPQYRRLAEQKPGEPMRGTQGASGWLRFPEAQMMELAQAAASGDPRAIMMWAMVRQGLG